ncbi:hypothetical protein PG994_005717 [Apiospora phragmitis]|uniref:Uncharacterized protein n=1 Tax=Apiospora phragmitis TaxID=2905665 RepID=A0ABR1VD07_9PEZI
MLSTVFTLLGLAWTSSFLLGAVKLVKLYLVTPSNLHRYVYSSGGGGGDSSARDQRKEIQKDPWAVVTGASDGIGRFLAQELAAAGFNVVLHGRNTTKLEKVQAELQRAHPARSFRLLEADAGLAADSGGDNDEGAQQLGLDVTAMVRNELEVLHITGLVNNVGGGNRNPLMGDFLEYSPRQNTEAVSKESLFAIHLTHALLPRFRKNRGGVALVISVGSMADVGMPLTATYSASKAFNKTLLETLALEDRLARMEGSREGGEVEIMYVRLGDVTEVSWRRGPASLLMPDARTAARAILARVGCGRSVVTAHWAHELFRLAFAGLLASLREKLLLSIMRGWRAEQVTGSFK